jgi:CIC family chloride channel protein
MSQSRIQASLNRIFQKSYLGKWAVLGLLIGIVAGVGALVFYYLIQFSTNLILGGITGYYPPGPVAEPASLISIHPNFLLIPLSCVIGGLIAGLLVYSLAPEAEGHGTDEAIAAFHRKDGRIRWRVPIVKLIASIFTIGSGGSGGREGPTALISAGFGSFIGDRFKLSVKDMRIAVVVGIGAGIGSIFKSPFGGAILSAEILYCGGDFESEAVIPAFIASIVGYIVFASVAGFTPIFGTLTYTFTDPSTLLIYALLGIACGLVGRLHSTTFYFVKKVFASLSISKFVRPMIGAAVAGIIAIFFPQVIGLGYGFLQYLIDGKLSLITTNFFTLPLIATLILLIPLKIVATSFTVGSGGSAGVFAPSLVIGGFVGATFWVVTNTLIPGWITVPAPLIIIGMMALFAGVGRVPIAVILMVSEMTGSLALLAPAMVAVVLAYLVTGSKYTIYRSQVLNRSESPAHREEYNIPLLKRILVADAMNTHVVSLPPEESVQKAYQMMIDKDFKGIPIVESERVVGMVTMSDLLRVPREEMNSTNLKSIMTRDLLITYPDESLFEVLNKMTRNGVGRLPVVSRETNKLVGIITRTDVMQSYDKAVE